MAMDILSVLQQIVTIIALASGIIVAWLGLATWKQQIAGKTEHDLAWRTLKAVYQFRDTIYLTRTIGFLEDTTVRSRTITSSMSELEAILPEIEAMWGKETRERLYNFKSIGYRLLAALELERRGALKKEKKSDSILVGAVDKSDKFSQEVENMMEGIHADLQPKINLMTRNRKRRK